MRQRFVSLAFQVRQLTLAGKKIKSCFLLFIILQALSTVKHVVGVTQKDIAVRGTTSSSSCESFVYIIESRNRLFKPHTVLNCI